MVHGIGFYKADQGAVDAWRKWHEENLSIPFPDSTVIGDRLLIQQDTLVPVLESVEAFRKYFGPRRVFAKSAKGKWLFSFLNELYRLRDNKIKSSEHTEAQIAQIDHASLHQEYISKLITVMQRHPQKKVEELAGKVKRAMRLKEECPKGLFKKYRKEAKAIIGEQAAERPKEAAATELTLPNKEEGLPLPQPSEFQFPANGRQTELPPTPEASEIIARFLGRVLATSELSQVIEKHPDIAHRQVKQLREMVDEWITAIDGPQSTN